MDPSVIYACIVPGQKLAAHNFEFSETKQKSIAVEIRKFIMVYQARLGTRQSDLSPLDRGGTAPSGTWACT
jgi:hypothetical protein